MKAVARACAEVPALNGWWIDGRFVPGTGVHVGCAISLREGGLGQGDWDKITILGTPVEQCLFHFRMNKRLIPFYER